MIEITHFQRKKRPNSNHSIESYFKAIRDLQPNDIKINVKIFKFTSSGIFKRIYIALEAFFNQKDINHNTGDIHFANIFLPKAKNLLTIHDCGFLKRISGLKFKIVKYFWYTLPAKRTNYITVNSNATKQDLLTYINFPKDKIKVIYIFVPHIHKPFYKQFNKQKPVILQIGTAPNKNITRIAQALKGIDCTYVILGKLNEEITKILTECSIDFKNINNSISDEDVAKLYQDCDIVSFASTFEGFGMPIIEANATGRVVVTSNTTSMPEIANNAAELVNPFDIKAIKEGFLKVINDDDFRNQLITNGFENVKRFNKEQIASQYYNLYREIYSNNPN